MAERPSQEVLEALGSLAEPLHRSVTELGIGEGEVHHRLGMWQVLEGRLEGAISSFQKAISMGVGYDAWLAHGDCLWMSDRRKKARDAYRPCKNMKRVPAHVFQRCAQVGFDERRFTETLADLQPILTRKKPDIEAFTLAALAYGKLDDHENAVSILEQGLERHPDAPLLLANMIIPLARMGNTERANEVYERARELDPELADAPFAMGVARMHQKDDEAAIELLEEALDLRPEYPEALFCLGVIHNHKGEFRNALEHFQLAVELKPDYAEAYYNMKDSYDGLRDFEGSIAMLEKAVQLNPEYR